MEDEEAGKPTLVESEKNKSKGQENESEETGSNENPEYLNTENSNTNTGNENCESGNDISGHISDTATDTVVKHSKVMNNEENVSTTVGEIKPVEENESKTVEKDPIVESNLAEKNAPVDSESQTTESIEVEVSESMEDLTIQGPVVDPELVSSMSSGFLDKFLPDLQHSKSMLEELMRNQQVLIETIDQENSKFSECQSFQQLEETMKKVKFYHSKLLSLKKEMNNLHEKSVKLKKRAVKLQQQKQKDELHRAHKRDKEMEREKMLEAKPAPRRHVTPTTDTTPQS